MVLDKKTDTWNESYERQKKEFTELFTESLNQRELGDIKHILNYQYKLIEREGDKEKELLEEYKIPLGLYHKHELYNKLNELCWDKAGNQMERTPKNDDLYWRKDVEEVDFAEVRRLLDQFPELFSKTKIYYFSKDLSEKKE